MVFIEVGTLGGVGFTYQFRLTIHNIRSRGSFEISQVKVRVLFHRASASGPAYLQQTILRVPWNNVFFNVFYLGLVGEYFEQGSVHALRTRIVEVQRSERVCNRPIMFQ